MSKVNKSAITESIASLGAYGAHAAQHVLLSLDHETRRLAAMESVNLIAAQLRELKVTIGRNAKVNGCPIAMEFHATLVAGGIKIGSANNYLTAFKEAVSTGKKITDWNSQRAKGKGKGGAGKGKATLDSLLLKAFNHAEFKGMCELVQGEYEDAKGDMHACIASWLTAMGAEIK